MKFDQSEEYRDIWPNVDPIWHLSLLDFSSLGDHPWISAHLVLVGRYRLVAQHVPVGNPNNNCRPVKDIA